MAAPCTAIDGDGKDYMHANANASSMTWLRSRAGVALVVFLGIAAFFLITEHTAHFFGVLPYLLLLACPLLHLFMHGGHEKHDAEESSGIQHHQSMHGDDK